jgi:cell division septal protein FtsQ
MGLSKLFKRRNRYRPPDSRDRLARRLSSLFATTVSIFLIVCILGLLGWGGWTFYAFLFLSDYFEIREVTVTLVDDTTSEVRDAPDAYRERLIEEIRQILSENGSDRGNLITLKTRKVRQDVETHGRVRHASVRKRYPSELQVEIETRRTEVLVLDREILAVDKDRVVAEVLTTQSPEAARFPYVTGLKLEGVPGKRIESESLTKALLLLSSLRSQAPVLAGKISDIYFDGTGNLTLYLRGGTEIRFGKDDPIRKMPALETFISKKGQPELFAYIDLRVEGEVAAMSREKAAELKAAELKAAQAANGPNKSL